VVSLLAAPAPALAAAGCPKTNMADVENEVMCLQCGVPLNLADAGQAVGVVATGDADEKRAAAAG